MSAAWATTSRSPRSPITTRCERLSLRTDIASAPHAISAITATAAAAIATMPCVSVIAAVMLATT